MNCDKIFAQLESERGRHLALACLLESTGGDKGIIAGHADAAEALAEARRLLEASQCNA